LPCETETLSVGVIGARGYVGQELLRLLWAHPALETTVAVSREYAGKRVSDACAIDAGGLCFSEAFDPRRECPDVVILGLPNGHARGVVEAIDRSGAEPRLVLDLSSDFRFTDDWSYGVPELQTDGLRGATRIANPGCYATAMQLTLAPVLERLSGAAHCFGVSGYSGAGTTPSEKNDAEALSKGVLAYAPVGHTHEREVSRHLGCDARLAPMVAGYPRGITLTARFELDTPMQIGELAALYARRYEGEAFVAARAGGSPRVQEVAGTPAAIVGGFAVDDLYPRRAAVVCVIDNLLKGAASQALQNINIALGHEHTLGIE